MKRVTIADVANHANVSKSTVSQYINKRYDYMGEETKERIEKTIKELEYSPNMVAKSLKQKSTLTIGVIVANILHVFSTQVIRAIEDVCQENDFHVIVCNADDNPEKEKKYIEMLRAKQVDGMIVFPTGGNKDLYESLFNEGYPLIFVDRFVENLPIDSILLDNEAAAKLAVDHFVSKGYERIAILTTSIIRNITPRVERISGYKKALQASGIPIREEYIKSLDLNEIHNGLKEMLFAEHPPQAILAGNDLTLMQILNFVQEHKIQIPKELALIGIDELSFANIYSPSLTIVSQPTFEMGEMAASLLLKKVKKEDTKNEGCIHRLQPTLVIRESC